MKKSTAYSLSGAALGLFLGSSIGVATGGDAYNGSVFLTPLGAFIGWLISKAKNQDEEVASKTNNVMHETPSASEPKSDSAPETLDSVSTGFSDIFGAAFAIMATVWNFFIAVLQMIKLLPVFIDKPWLFFVLPIVVSFFFPPFLAIYFLAYLSASHFGISEETGYRATLK